ncbi:Putative adhesin [Amycolatopsis arida]|uniref:Putative adhesin n=1 Tax=Amycolatopsis arida TaxID=587909 RepID=A0A1I5VF20_9PSEU|nr:DUF4097 family beta strand repeat-containing protein [Amycolatopsis arida]TDX91259.1 putative adhesin [Amycolatopsis arida]SFQ06079.1 Putative adhesin [Amycolatopsis arida]
MTEQPSEQSTERPDELVRTQTFPTDGPVELDVDITIGRVDIRLDTPHGTAGENGAAGAGTGEAGTGEASVEVRHDPTAQQPWAEGVAQLLGWVGERFGPQLGTDLRGSPAEAVRQVRIEKLGNRLVVRGPKALALRNVPLAITVHAPAGSRLDLRTGAGDVAVAGTAGRADVATVSGEVSLDRVDGSTTVRTGSGAIRLGTALAGLQVRTGSGDVEASSVADSATLATGTGDVWLGVTAGRVLVRSGRGDLSVAEAASGELELITGSGDVRVGIRSGVAAEVRLSSASGRVASELDVADSPPDGEVALRVRARTGSGTALVTKAAR